MSQLSKPSLYTHRLPLFSFCSLVLFLACFQRFSLAWVNRDANDDHYQVMLLLKDGFRSLSMQDCRECFHPKLYYFFCVAAFKSFGIDAVDRQLLFAQLINSFAGVFTIGIIGIFLMQNPANWLSGVLVFAFVALNPSLIGVNAQATNDSFVILFTTLAIYATCRLLKTSRVSAFIVVIVSLSGAVLSKGTAWPGAIAILIAFAMRGLLKKGERRRYCVFFALSATAVATCISYGGYDFENFDKYAATAKGKPLYLFERTEVGRPGVVSIWDSYLTFRFVDLLLHPVNSRSRELNPEHRSSLWTQLYGRLNSIQFDYHPPSWRSDSQSVKLVNRSVFVLGLVVLFTFLIGTVKVMVDFVSDFFAQGAIVFVSDHRLFLWLTATGYISFIIVFTFSYRDFSAMKAIYIFPGMLAFAEVLRHGLSTILSKLRIYAGLRGLFLVAFVGLLLMYFVNVELLVRHLAS